MTTIHATITVSVESKRSEQIFIAKSQLEVIKTCKDRKGSGDYCFYDMSFCTSDCYLEEQGMETELLIDLLC